MADKLTLVELHLHADNNEFESELELNSDIGEVLRNRLGFGKSEEDDVLPFGSDETDSSATADGGDTLEIGEDEDDELETETETETGSAVVEIDPDTEVEDEPDYDDDEDSGRGIGGTLLLLLVVGLLAAAAWWYLGDDDIENEFEEL